LPAADKIHLKYSNKNLVKVNFASHQQKYFYIFMWYQGCRIGAGVVSCRVGTGAVRSQRF